MKKMFNQSTPDKTMAFVMGLCYRAKRMDLAEFCMLNLMALLTEYKSADQPS